MNPPVYSLRIEAVLAGATQTYAVRATSAQMPSIVDALSDLERATGAEFHISLADVSVDTEV